jgi:Ca-activated chloride channel family protein
MADWNGFPFVWKSTFSRTAVFFARVCAFLAFLCALFAFAEPVVKKKEKVYESRGTDILFVLDTSPSMAARDILREGGNAVSRFDAAKEIIAQLAAQNSGQMGIASFASEAVLVVPSTSDTEFFLRRLEEITVGALGDGSGVGTGLALAIYHLASSGIAPNEAQAQKKCAVLLTDGENNTGSIHPLTAARLANEHGVTLYVAGLGTTGRVPFEYVDSKTGAVYSGYFDSRFDERALKILADESGGSYFSVTSLKELNASLTQIASREQTAQIWHYRTDITRLYGKFLTAAIACAVLFFAITKIILKELL